MVSAAPRAVNDLGGVRDRVEATLAQHSCGGGGIDDGSVWAEHLVVRAKVYPGGGEHVREGVAPRNDEVVLLTGCAQRNAP